MMKKFSGFIFLYSGEIQFQEKITSAKMFSHIGDTKFIASGTDLCCQFHV